MEGSGPTENEQPGRWSRRKWVVVAVVVIGLGSLGDALPKRAEVALACVYALAVSAAFFVRALRRGCVLRRGSARGDRDWETPVIALFGLGLLTSRLPGFQTLLAVSVGTIAVGLADRIGGALHRRRTANS